MQPILVEGMIPIQFITLENYGMKAAVSHYGVCERGSGEFLLDLREIVEKRLMPLFEDLEAQACASLTTMAEATDTDRYAGVSLGPERRGALYPLCYYYPSDDEEGLTRFFIDLGVREANGRIGRLFSAFNDQRQFIYEHFPHLKGRIKSYEDINSVITTEQRDLCVRKYLESMNLKGLRKFVTLKTKHLKSVSREFIEGERTPEQEFKQLQPITLLNEEAKSLGTGYVGKGKEENFVHVDLIQTVGETHFEAGIRIYYPNDDSKSFVAIGGINKIQSQEDMDPRILDSVDECLAMTRGLYVEESDDYLPILDLNVDRREVRIQWSVPSFTRRVVRASNRVIGYRERMETLKEFCRKNEIHGFSNKNRDELLEMICEFQTEKYKEFRSLDGCYMTKDVHVSQYGSQEKSGPYAPEIIGRIADQKVYLPEREFLMDEKKLNRTQDLHDMLNPFAENMTFVNEKIDPDEKVELIGAKPSNEDSDS